MMSNRLAVVGGIYREVLSGDTQPRHRFGGSGLTSAVVASRLGATTSLASFVGQEDEETVRDLLSAGDVDHESVVAVPGSSGIFVFPQERPNSPPWPMYRPAESTPEKSVPVGDASVYLVFGLPDIDPITEGWLDAASESATLLWDRQGWMSRARDYIGARSLPPLNKIYLANSAEAQEEFPDGEGRFSGLPPEGFRAAVVKRGSEGCTLITETSSENHSAFLVGADLSSIGSGDAFAGGLAAALVSGFGLDKAVIVANAAAATFMLTNGDALAFDFGSRVGELCHERGFAWNLPDT